MTEGTKARDLKRVHVSMRLPEDLHRVVMDLSREHDRSLSRMLEYCIRVAVREIEPKTKDNENKGETPSKGA
jgi:hypothetical protein